MLVAVAVELGVTEFVSETVPVDVCDGVTVELDVIVDVAVSVGLSVSDWV